MRAAMRNGELFPTTGMYMWPTAPGRQEMGLNTTRAAAVDPFDTEALSRSVATLSQQVFQALSFVRAHVPGFAAAQVSGVAPRVGIRETRRIIGEDRLETEDVIEGRKRDEVVAKGGHHVDVHGAGTQQQRVHVKDGRSYDVPFGALVPREVANVLVAGRCFSSSREANGSARHMGSCMAMGQAAGTAAALTASKGLPDVRDLDIQELQQTLRSHGGVLTGIA